MPSSRRNARPNAGSNTKSPIPLQDLYNPAERPNEAAQAQQLMQAEERPTEPITWRIRLNQNDITEEELSLLRANLQASLGRHNMNLSPRNPNTDIVTISGTPPDYHFEGRLVEIVRGHAPDAEVVRA